MSEQESESEKGEWDLYELCKLGDEYRKEYDFEMFGKSTSVTIKPLIDEDAIPYSIQLKEKFGAETKDEALEEAEDYVDEARDEEGQIEMSEVDDEFMEIMKDVYDDGLCADLTWSEFDSQEAGERKNFVRDRSRDGAVIDISMEILDLSGTLEDALKFPGRGRQ